MSSGSMVGSATHLDWEGQMPELVGSVQEDADQLAQYAAMVASLWQRRGHRRLWKERETSYRASEVAAWLEDSCPPCGMFHDLWAC